MRLLYPLAALAVLAAGCGHIEYGRSSRGRVTVTETTPGAYTVAQGSDASICARPDVVCVPNDQGAQPPPAPQPRYHAYTPPAAPVTCGAGEHIRVHDRVVRARRGPAIVATGNCVVEVTESVIRGRPAIILQDDARVAIVESRILGDVQTPHPAQVVMRGSRLHRRARIIATGY